MILKEYKIIHRGYKWHWMYREKDSVSCKTKYAIGGITMTKKKSEELLSHYIARGRHIAGSKMGSK